jgi:hypothetical protein
VDADSRLGAASGRTTILNSSLRCVAVVTAVPWESSGHPTMKSQNRLAKSVSAKYPFCGVENRPMW